MRLVFSRQAKADIDAIWTYVASESGSAEIADRVADSLNKTLTRLRHSPGIGKNREQDLRPGLRSHPSGRYLIFYRVDAGVVRIVRVLHGRRDIPAILG
jgi:toxin ParE1/3/4